MAHAPLELHLTSSEMTTAAMVGVRRQVFAIAKSLKDAVHDKSVCDFNPHIVGAMAELVIASHFNMFWGDNVGILAAGDVGGLLEVRARNPDVGCDLGLTEQDWLKKPKKPFILCHIKLPIIQVMGWIMCADGWRAGTESGLPSLRWVKTDRLRSIDELEYILSRNEVDEHLVEQQLSEIA